jgi:hypothetical protein
MTDDQPELDECKMEWTPREVRRLPTEDAEFVPSS